jgi:hypothetical protein
MSANRVALYQSNAKECRHQATLPQNESNRDRWLKLADQWSNMADEAKRQPARIRGFRRRPSSQIHSPRLA